MFLNMGSNKNVNMLCFFSCEMHAKENERLKSLQYLVIHANNELFEPKIKNVYILFSQAINNYFKFKVFLNLLTG